MRKDPLVTGRYYHIYNRGVDKRDIFMDMRDLYRFMLSVKAFNTVNPIGGIKEIAIRHSSDVGRLTEEKPLISIVCYCFNPNHFHFIVKQEVDGGISEFYKRLLGGYTKYFNEIHNRSGSLFQGRFKSCLINDEQYSLKIYPYVNMNYSIHEIPMKKSHLVWASDREYDSGKFDIVSEKESKDVLDVYGSSENFKKECLDAISIIRQQRGNTSLFQEDPLP
ncbi:transposase [Candidatus Parcubacteria bacterium]|nr:transposase [Candidatus Parcubacteria bacterium]